MIIERVQTTATRQLTAQDPWKVVDAVRVDLVLQRITVLSHKIAAMQLESAGPT